MIRYGRLLQTLTFEFKLNPCSQDAFNMYPSKNARSLDGRQSHHYPPRQQQQQKRHHDDDWRPIADRRRSWRGQRRFGTVGRWRRNAFQAQNNVNNNASFRSNILQALIKVTA